MVGKFSAIIGPPLMTIAGLLTDSRTSILALLVLFAGGMWFLAKVREHYGPDIYPVSEAPKS